MIGRGGCEEPQTRLGVEGGDDVLDEVARGQQVLEALDREPVPNGVGPDLGDLLVVSEADQVVVVNDVLAPYQERTDVPTPVLNETVRMRSVPSGMDLT